jgi:hypothetical protein
MELEYAWLKDYPNFHIELRNDGFVAIKHYNLTYNAYREVICDEQFLRQSIEGLSKRVLKEEILENEKQKI